MKISNPLQKSLSFVLALVLAIPLISPAPAAAAESAPTVVTIDGDAADTNPANTFKGYGLVSANNTSRLLLDYKEEHPDQYWEMMNLLFNQDTGAGINDIKIEMGNDSNTSSGTEPATKRSADEEANVRRGAGYLFAADAKTINPDIKVSILRWTQPGWVQPWSDGNTDPSQPATLAAYERMYKWYKDTAIAIHDTYGYDLDYINPDRNETGTPNVNFIKWFANRMRSDAEFPNYDKIKIIASDENTSLNIPTRMLADPDLMNAVDVMAYHYNMATSADYLKVNEQNQKEVWYSEGVAPQTFAKYRANSDEKFGGVASALDVAGRFIGMYTQGKRTHYMFQPAIGAFYSGAPYSSKELIGARDPWSGYYVPDVGIQTVMQFTQFAADGWMYIPNASLGVIGSRGNSEMDGNAAGAEYNRLAFVSPDKKDFSVVMVNDSDRVAEYQFDVKKNIANAGSPLQVWETRGADAGQAYDANWYKQLANLASTDNGDVYSYTLTVKPHSMVSVTSTTVNPNTGNPRTPYTRNNDIPEQSVLDVDGSNPAVLYEDDFEYADYPADSNGLSYIERRGGTPRYTADQGGAFEVYPGIGQDGSNGMKQMIYSGNKPGTWATTPFSYTVLGDERWANYETSVDFKMDQDPTHTGDNYVAIGMRHKLNGTTSDSESGYKFRVYADGTWRLIRLTATVASGTLTGFDASKWHRISIKGASQFITASLDGKVVTTYNDTASGAPLSGQVMIQTSLQQSVFDNLKVEAVNGYVPYVAERVDDLDSRVTYHEGSFPWAHSLSGGAGRLNRTISTSGTSIMFSSASKTEGTLNRWYMVKNEGNTAAWSSNNTNAWAGETGSYASLTFNGTGVSVYGQGQGTNAVVRMDVYLDDFGTGYNHDASKRVVTSKAYANNSSSQLIYQISGLAPGVHNVKIVKTAAASGSGNYLSIEKAVVTADAADPTSFELPFTGSGFRLVGDTGAATIDVAVDDKLVGTNIAIPAASVNRTDTYSYEGLSYGPHTLKVSVKDGSFSIDAIDILGEVYGTVSKAALADLITQVSGYEEADYMPTEWGAFTAAIEAAQAVLADEAATQYKVDLALNNLKDASGALKLRTQPVAVTGTYPTIIATRSGQAVTGLPDTVKVTLADGTTDADATVHWLNNTPERFSTPYSSVQVTGEIVGGNNLSINVQVEVVPDNLVYFLDPGVSDSTTTPPYNAVKTLVGDSLLNNAADQPSTGDTVWGHTPTDTNYKYKAISGAVVATNKSQTGVYGSDTMNNPLGYVLPLTAGDYTITSFHRDWWNNTNRTMDITLSYKDADNNVVALPVRTGLIAGPDGTTVTYDFTLPVDSTVTYSINNTYTGNQAALISYLGVAKRVADPADVQALKTAKSLIEAGNYTVKKVTANSEDEVKAWLEDAIQGLDGLSATGASVDSITLDAFQAATEDTNGSFSFTVQLSKGLAKETAASEGVIATKDTVKPVISLNGDAVVNLPIGAEYTDAGATALDDWDGDLTGSIITTITNDVNDGTTLDTSVAGTYIFHYNVSDAAGNAADEVTRTIVVSEDPDTVKPVIRLLGDATVNLANGASYTDTGATASDDRDGDITGQIVRTITNNVNNGTTLDTSVAGTYTFHYNVSDAAGNAADEVTRTVIVAERIQPPVVTNPTPSDPTVPATTQVLTSADLQNAVSGTITVTVANGKNTVQFPSNVVQLVGDNTLKLVMNGMTISFTKDDLAGIMGAVTGTQASGANISFSAVKVPNGEVNSLINNQAVNGTVNLTTASTVYDFSLSVIRADGTAVPVPTFDEPLKLTFTVDPNANPDLLGVYYIATDGALQYVGGTLADGVMTAYVKHFSHYAVLEYDKSFTDVSPAFWAHDVIQQMAARHIVTGISDTLFNPEGNVTRAEFAAMIARALGLEDVDGSVSFLDVKADAWYAGYIGAVSKAGIVMGRSSNTFAPNDAITREEMVVMTVRAYEYVKGEQADVANGAATFVDGSSISAWAQDAAGLAQELGLINGRDNNMFAPQALMTRAEGAQVIGNLISLL
ncbi:S-layer family protein [Paenibacillus sp. BK033]|uniref:S-layer homology domain-containing protein n=1 Tax=Paenibacillus sp. BK033 TaxID=2512133 RepID=UPI001042C26E|nr:S-layer homology domain-containing protein [Paenibacillus sp. BK033]TCM97871.1 S-layer family protein [Paenibacillus sp. BK033]